MTAAPQQLVLSMPAQGPDPPDWAAAVARLDAIVDLLAGLARLAEANAVQAEPHDRYTTEEVARLLGRQPRTPQKWCRDRQVNCVRIARDGTYRIAREEVERVRNHGLLPPWTGAVAEE